MRASQLGWVFLLGMPLLMGKKCRQDPPPDDGTGGGQQLSEGSLGLVMLSPSTVAPNQAVPAKLLGSGFAGTLSVTVGGVPAADVRVASENALGLTLPALAEGSYDVMVSDGVGGKATLISGLTVKTGSVRISEQCRSIRLFFGDDQDGLSREAQTALSQNVSCWTGSAGAIRLEGHADSRGTTDYNVALGQRRAESVQRWLLDHGVSPSRTTSMSYGEERPLDPSGSEAALAQNRRVDVLLSE